ncbi:hypothetical protein HUJ04_009430 [Dendroctonus ponderosae]|nr:hypothetical protein HUJ04_009430 [Dendroctonus ponderosae]
MHRHADSSVNANGWIEHPIQIPECDFPLRLLVDVKLQPMMAEVQQYSNRRSHMDAAFDPLFMSACMLEPRSLPINVHGPSFIILS